MEPAPEAVEAAAPAESGEPMEPTEPMEPMEPMEPTEAMEPAAEPAPANPEPAPEEPAASPEAEAKTEKSEKSERPERPSKREKAEKADKEKEEKCAITKEILEGAPAVPEDKVKEFFNCANAEALNAYDTLNNFAREAGLVVEIPHFILVGPTGGKSTLLEAIVGHPVVSMPKKGYVKTQRPLVFTINYNDACETPRITIMRDTIPDSSFTTNVTVSVEELPAALNARNTSSSVPIYVTYETKDMMSMCIVDTPALKPDGKSDATLLPLIQKCGEARSRFILCVEQAGAWPSSVSTWAKKNNLTNCIGVYTEAKKHFATFTNGPAITKYIADRPGNYTNHLFVTLLPSCLAGGLSTAAFREAICKVDALTKASCTGVDRRFELFITLARMRTVVFDLVLSAFRQVVPAIKQGHKQLQEGVRNELAAVNKQIQSLNPQKLRGYATNTGTTYYRFMQSMLEGTVENLLPSHHATFGQNLEEECRTINGGPWLDSDSLAIHFDADDWNVPAAGRRLLGRQQFERLLSEFRIVMQHTVMDQLTLDEVVTECGQTSKTAGIKQVATLASELARQRLEKQVLPLVLQFCHRIVYIMHRIAETSDDVARAIRKSPVASRNAVMQDLAGDFPFFHNWLNMLYYKFVDEAMETFEQKCRVEFLSTPVLAWSVLEQQQPDAVREYKPGDDLVVAVRGIADAVFISSRDRICNNVLLKCYDYFFDKNNLWSRIVEDLNDKIVDEILDELFEVASTQERLKKQSGRIQGRLDALIAEENTLNKAVTSLSAK